MTTLILPKLGACRTAREAVEKLEAMGARPCGSGFYSRVYRVEVREEIDRAPMSYMDFRAVANLKPWEIMQRIRPSFATERRVRVIKVALTRDPGGLMAANAAMLTKDYDDLAPRYYGVTEFGDGTWMGELEELVPVANYYDNVDYCGHSDKTRHLTAGTREPVGELFETSVYLRTLRDMRSTYTSKNPSKSCNWDIHGDNVMMRGAQPVITDPLSAS